MYFSDLAHPKREVLLAKNADKSVPVVTLDAEDAIAGGESETDKLWLRDKPATQRRLQARLNLRLTLPGCPQNQSVRLRDFSVTTKSKPTLSAPLGDAASSTTVKNASAKSSAQGH